MQDGPLDLGAVERVGDQAPVGAPARRTCRRPPRRASARWRGGCRGRARPAPWRCGGARRRCSAPAPRCTVDDARLVVVERHRRRAGRRRLHRPAPPVRAGPLGQPGLDRQLAGERPPQVLEHRLATPTPAGGGTTRNCDAAIAGPPSSPEYAHAVSTSRPRSDSTPAMRANEPGSVVAHDGDPSVRCRPRSESLAARCARRRRRPPSSTAPHSSGKCAARRVAQVGAVEHERGCARRGRRRAVPSTSPTPTGRWPASRPR